MSQIPLNNNVDATAPRIPETTPAIADTSYQTYNGPLLPRLAGISRWGTVALGTIRQAVNHKRFGYWIPATLIAIWYLIAGATFYFQHGVQRNMGAMAGAFGADPAPVNEYGMALYNAQNWFFHVMVFATAITVGAASIAADTRANALLVYLSKPLGRSDYLIGKWLGIFLLLAALNLVPALLLYLFFLASYYDEGFVSGNPTLIFKVIVASLVPAAVQTSLIIGISAWSKTPRLAGAVYAGVFFLFWSITGTINPLMMRQRSASPEVVALVNNFSVVGASDAIAQHLYNTTSQPLMVQVEAVSQKRRERIRKVRWEREARWAKERGLKPPPPLKPEPAPSDNPEEAPMVAARPPLVPSLLIVAALIVLPIVAASARIKAVEVVRG